MSTNRIMKWLWERETYLAKRFRIFLLVMTRRNKNCRNSSIEHLNGWRMESNDFIYCLQQIEWNWIDVCMGREIERRYSACTRVYLVAYLEQSISVSAHSFAYVGCGFAKRKHNVRWTRQPWQPPPHSPTSSPSQRQHAQEQQSYLSCY